MEYSRNNFYASYNDRDLLSTHKPMNCSNPLDRLMVDDGHCDSDDESIVHPSSNSHWLHYSHPPLLLPPVLILVDSNHSYLNIVRRLDNFSVSRHRPLGLSREKDRNFPSSHCHLEGWIVDAEVGANIAIEVVDTVIVGVETIGEMITERGQRIESESERSQRMKDVESHVVAVVDSALSFVAYVSFVDIVDTVGVVVFVVVSWVGVP